MKSLRAAGGDHGVAGKYRPVQSIANFGCRPIIASSAHPAAQKDYAMRKLTVSASAAVLCIAAGAEEQIEITSIDARTTIRGPEQAYTGAAIAEVLFGATASSRLTAVEVTFEPGAHTAWHNHPAGQYLVVTSGIGWVQQRGGAKREVRAGDVVWTPPGVAHWHGATPTHAMSHFAIWEFVDGSGGELFEHVSDEDYRAVPDLGASPGN
jgi:quercetin dioxygenase-like cupin family protein